MASPYDALSTATFKVWRRWFRFETENFELLRDTETSLIVGYHGGPWTSDLWMLGDRMHDELGFFHQAGGEWVGWSWAQYRGRSARAGSGLRLHGVQPGDHVLLLIVEIDVAVTTLFGLWSIGAVPIVVGLPYRLDDVGAFVAELRRTAQRLDARALVVSDAFAALVEDKAQSPRVLAAGRPAPVAQADRSSPNPQGGGCIRSPLGSADDSTPRDVPSGASVDPWDPIDPAAPALIQLTSGSTGHPRGVVLSHRAVLAKLAAISTALPAGDDAREVTWLPLRHDMGRIGGLLYPLFNGFPVNVLSPLAFRSDPFRWLRTMSDVRATCTPAPPFGVCDRDAPRAQGGRRAARRVRAALRDGRRRADRSARAARLPRRLRAVRPARRGVLPRLRARRGDGRGHLPARACRYAHRRRRPGGPPTRGAGGPGRHRRTRGA